MPCVGPTREGFTVVVSVAGACSGAHEPRGEGTTPLPPSPFLAPTTFYTSTCCSYFSNALSAPPEPLQPIQQHSNNVKFCKRSGKGPPISPTLPLISINPCNIYCCEMRSQTLRRHNLMMSPKQRGAILSDSQYYLLYLVYLSASAIWMVR